MKVNEYVLFDKLIQDGLQYAITRLFKYRENKTITEQELRNIVEQMAEWIMTDFCDTVIFEGSGIEE